MGWIREDGKVAGGWMKGSNSKPVAKKALFEKPSKVKLTWEDVDKIRLDSKKGTKTSHIAKSYGVSNACIYNIIKNKTWKK